jgi:hypothetical protein
VIGPNWSSQIARRQAAGTGFNPLAKHGFVVCRQGMFGRHLFIANSLPDQAFVGVSWDHDHTTIAAARYAPQRRKIKARLGVEWPVALHTPLREEHCHLFFPTGLIER